MQLLTKIQDDFTGALYKRYGTYLSPPNTLSKMQNVTAVKGGIRKIGGSSAMNISTIGASAVDSLYRAYIGAKSISLATAGTFMYYYSVATSNFISCVSGLSAASPWSFVTYKNGAAGSDYIYVTNGVNNALRIDLSTYPSAAPTISVMSAAGTMPTYPCKFYFVAGERLWAGANTTMPDRAYYCSKDASGVGLPEVWSSDKYLAFPRESANLNVVGGIDWRDNPVLITERTVSVVLGDNNSEFEQPIMESNVGCAARRTIQNLGGLVLFLSRDGVYAFGGGACKSISLDIQAYIDDINPTYISNAVAIADANRYILSYTSTAAGGTINNRTLVFDTRIGDVQGGLIKGGWEGPHTIGAVSFMWYSGPGDNGELYYGDASATGLVYKFMDDTKTSFNGNAIDCDCETYDYTHEEVARLDLKKQISEVVVFAEPEASGGNISASYYSNDVTSDTQIGTVSLATTGKERGDKSGQTSVTRTIINHPLKVTPASTSTCYFNRLRFRCNDAVSRCVIRKVIQLSTLLEKQSTE